MGNSSLTFAQYASSSSIAGTTARVVGAGVTPERPLARAERAVVEAAVICKKVRRSMRIGYEDCLMIFIIQRRQCGKHFFLVWRHLLGRKIVQYYTNLSFCSKRKYSFATQSS